MVVGCLTDGTVRGFADTFESRADDLLFPLPHVLHGHCLWCGCLAQGTFCQLLEGVGRFGGGRSVGCVHQSV